MESQVYARGHLIRNIVRDRLLLTEESVRKRDWLGARDFL